MSKIRYVDKVYPIFISLEEEVFMKQFHQKVKDSEGFVAIVPCDKLKQTFTHLKFGIGYDTEENASKFGAYLTNIGFGNYVYVAEKEYHIDLKNEMPIYSDYRNDPSFKEWLSSKKKSYNDIVSLSYNDYNKVRTSVYDEIMAKRILITDLCDKDKLPLPRFTLNKTDDDGNIKEITHYVYQKETNKLFVESELPNGEKLYKLFHEISDYDDYTIQLEFGTRVLYTGRMLDTQSSLFEDNIGGVDNNNFFTNTLWSFFYINYFIRMIPTCYVKNTMRVNETFVEGKGIHKKTKSKIVLKTEYKVSVRHLTVKHIKHIFKCLCWGVRGHYRHLPSGRIIFVKAHYKGKERNNLEAFKGKEYKL